MTFSFDVGLFLTKFPEKNIKASLQRNVELVREYYKLMTISELFGSFDTKYSGFFKRPYEDNRGFSIQDLNLFKIDLNLKISVFFLIGLPLIEINTILKETITTVAEIVVLLLSGKIISFSDLKC